jgi:hypothetical protein
MNKKYTACIVMKWLQLVPIIILLVMVVPTSTEAQDEEQIVLEIINLYLPKNDEYSRSVTLIPYAQYDLECQAIPINATSIGGFVTFNLHSEKHRAREGVWDGHLHNNRSYIPRTYDYQLDITNECEADVYVNYTLTQTGPPVTAFYTPEDVVSQLIVPMVVIVVIPTVSSIISIILYRKLRFKDIAMGKTRMNPKHVLYAMIGIALLSPQNFDVYSGISSPLEFSLLSTFWRYTSDVRPYLTFVSFYVWGYVPFFLGLLFIFLIYRCYQARTTRKQALFVGLLRFIWDIIPPIRSYIFILSNPSSPFVSFGGPIPMLFIIGIALLFLLPPPEPPKTWDDEIGQVM